MFHSAVVRLTAWYLLILMSISVLFSFTIYSVTSGEIRNRLTQLQDRYEQPGRFLTDPNHRLFSAFRANQHEAAERSLFLTLLYVNVLILLGGGLLSYLLARRTLRQIEEAHENQSRFTSDASHELRTPLAAMKTELEVALRDPKLSKSDMRELLESNLEEVNKLTTLSRTLLQLSKMDYTNLALEAVNLGEIVSEITQKYDKNAMRIKFELPPQPIYVKANRASMEELVTILVDNALKYSPPDSKIKTALTKRGRQAEFRIANKGEGISEEHLPRIFDRFFRANESRNDGGSGLGLALAKEIVDLHKGELSVTSGKKRETTFRFTLPVAKATNDDTKSV